MFAAAYVSFCPCVWQYDKCLPLLSKAVERNALQFDVWTRLAYAALQLEDWKACAAAYRRCCYLEPDVRTHSG